MYPSCPAIKSDGVRHNSLPRLASLAAGVRVADPLLLPFAPFSFSRVAPPSCMTIHEPLGRTGYSVSVDFVQERENEKETEKEEEKLYGENW